MGNPRFSLKFSITSVNRGYFRFFETLVNVNVSCLKREKNIANMLLFGLV